MEEKRVLIVNEMHQSIMPLLKGIGLQVDYEPKISRKEILEKIPGYFGIIVRSKLSLDKEFFERAVSLKFIGRAGAGLDQIDLGEVEKRDIKVFNAPEGNRDALGEHALGMLLALLHKIAYSNSEVKSGIWRREENRGVELNTKTVGIIGFGNMGSAFAEKLSGMACKILAFDIKEDLSVPSHINRVSLEDLKRDSDIVSIHVPLTKRTDHMVNEDWIRSFKKNIWIINTSRGKVLDLKALNKYMDEGKVLGAALDVLENENPRTFSEEEKTLFEKICNRKNTIITPHVGGWSEESYLRINEVLTSKIRKYLLQIG